MSQSEFLWPVRVYYEDTDAGGVVFYANYLKYMERARTEWLRSMGYEQDDLLTKDVLFAVRHVDIDYLHPARFNDSLSVSSKILAVSRVSIKFEQTVSNSLRVLCRATIKVVCLEASRFRLTALPIEIKEDFLSVC